MLHLVGQRGITVTALRPSGIALVDGRRVDVATEAEFVDKGSEIEVVSVNGVKILVKKV